jgi:putative transposase
LHRTTTFTCKRALMQDWPSPAHVCWYGKYPLVFVSKYRQRVWYGQLRQGIGRILRERSPQQSVEWVEGPARPEHIHLCLSIPLTYRVANTVGWRKGKSASRMQRECLGRERHGTGLPFWVRGSGVSTVGRDTQGIRALRGFPCGGNEASCCVKSDIRVCRRHRKYGD